MEAEEEVVVEAEEEVPVVVEEEVMEELVVLVVVVEVVIIMEGEVDMGEGFTMEDTTILGIGDMGGTGDMHMMDGLSGRCMGMIRGRYRVRMRKGFPHRVRIRFLR